MGDNNYIKYKNQKVATSRSFGDFDFKSNKDLPPYEQAIIAIPDIYIHERNVNDDAFIILASDGVWDVMTNEEVASFVLEHTTNKKNITDEDGGTTSTVLATVGDELVEECLYKRNSQDNISVVIVSLRKEDYDNNDIDE